MIYCFVQFGGIHDVGKEMPKIYIATIPEIARQLKSQRKGFGHCSLHEDYNYKRGDGRGYTDKIPIEWRFSVQRVEQLMNALDN